MGSIKLNPDLGKARASKEKLHILNVERCLVYVPINWGVVPRSGIAFMLPSIESGVPIPGV